MGNCPFFADSPEPTAKEVPRHAPATASSTPQQQSMQQKPQSAEQQATEPRAQEVKPEQVQSNIPEPPHESRAEARSEHRSESDPKLDVASVRSNPAHNDTETEGKLIHHSLLGPPCDPFDDNQPDWQWESDPGHWRSYRPDESILVDRYWTVYQSNLQSGSDACVARLQIARKDAVIDFAKMNAAVGGSRPRPIKRLVKTCDWLNNAYFFEAFKDALDDGGIKVESSPEHMFSFSFNQDFRGMRDDGRELLRGGQVYKLPVGWKRFAVNVKGQYDDGHNDWLREDETGWAVAYHGTAKDSLPGILSTGFRIGAGQKFEAETGAGIYCAPSVEVAQHYSRPREWRGHTVQIVLQLRVKPCAIRKITTGTAFEKNYWVINDPRDMRAYGVLIRELPLDEYVSAFEAVYGPEYRPEDLPKLKKEVYDRWWKK